MSEFAKSHVFDSPVSVVAGHLGKRKGVLGDRIFFALCAASALVIFALIGGVLVSLTLSAMPSIKEFGWGFITSSDWDPVNDSFGALPFLYGTLITSLFAIVIALPPGLGIAVFLVELARKKTRVVFSFLVEMLAAIPSVVYGVWAIFVLCPLLFTTVIPFLKSTIGWIPFFASNVKAEQNNMFAASVVLAVMVLPIITSISRDVMLAIPMSQREAALALGSTKWESIKIVLANARWGILGSIILGLGRALGETMAVTMVVGNSTEISTSLFKPGYSMASVIANEFTEAVSALHTSALIEVGLILLATTFVVNMIARLLVWSVTRRTVSGGRN